MAIESFFDACIIQYHTTGTMLSKMQKPDTRSVYFSLKIHVHHEASFTFKSRAASCKALLYCVAFIFVCQIHVAGGFLIHNGRAIIAQHYHNNNQLEDFGNSRLGYPFTILQQRQRQERRLMRGGVGLFMGKGDGKKKRPKQQKTTQTTESASTSAISKSASVTPAPRRVMSDINVPVRRQIRFAKMNKEYERSMTTSSFQGKKTVKTAYRKKLGKFIYESHPWSI
jgi:hypothetical protein